MTGVSAPYPLGDLGRIGLDLVAAVSAPDDQPQGGFRSIAERHRWAISL
jgi:hypothetical protein